MGIDILPRTLILAPPVVGLHIASLGDAITRPSCGLTTIWLAGLSWLLIVLGGFAPTAYLGVAKPF